MEARGAGTVSDNGHQLGYSRRCSAKLTGSGAEVRVASSDRWFGDSVAILRLSGYWYSGVERRWIGRLRVDLVAGYRGIKFDGLA